MKMKKKMKMWMKKGLIVVQKRRKRLKELIIRNNLICLKI